MQCRVTSEDPENNFIPDYGRISAYRSPAGFGIRLDAGTAYSGAIITPSYDSLLVKVTAWAPTPQDTIARMHRALWEFRVRGVATNLRFLDQLITHPRFAKRDYTTKFIDETPELFRFPRKRDRATRLLNFIGEVIVNGNDEVKGRCARRDWRIRSCRSSSSPPPAPGTKQKLDELGAERFAAWMLEQKRVLLTDTTMRDAHQSLLATRFRTHDLAAIAPYYASLAPDLFSVECWGGATFDVAMRFLNECPWQRLHELRTACRTCCCRCCCVRRMRSATRTIPTTSCATSSIRPRAAASICSASSTRSTGSRTCASRSTPCASRASCARRRSATPAISPIRARPKYDLKYYVTLARDLKCAGRAHSRDQGHGLASVSRAQAFTLVKALKEENRACRFISTRTTPAASPQPACSRRSKQVPTQSTARSMR
jgi:pyruvate carboxylase